MSKGKDSNHQCTNMSKNQQKDSTEMVQHLFKKGIRPGCSQKLSAILGTTEDQLRPALRCLLCDFQGGRKQRLILYNEKV